MYRSLLLALAALPLVASPASAQNVDAAPPPSAEGIAIPLTLVLPEGGGDNVYTNGPVINGIGTGADGADESIVQNVTVGTTTYGFGAQNALGTAVADDFEVPAGQTWDIDTITFYSYQTGSGTTSTLDGVFVEIYDGDPAAGGTVVVGDQTTNVLASTEFINAYRVLESGTCQSGTCVDRPIMEVVANVDVSLTEGTYWVAFGFTGTGASGPWAPPLATAGSCYAEGNAQQNTGAGWAPLVDGACTSVEFPFLLTGNATGNATEGGPSLPGEFALAAAVPNPAVATARVGVTVERAQALTVEVYDVLGRRVATAYDGLAAIGTVDVRIATEALPSGVYVIRATGERGAVTRALTVAH